MDLASRTTPWQSALPPVSRASTLPPQYFSTPAQYGPPGVIPPPVGPVVPPSALVPGARTVSERVVHVDTHDEALARLQRRPVGGVGIVLAHDTLQVVELAPGSPAAEAGLTVGDYLIGVDHNDVRGMTIETVRELIRGPAESIVRLRFHETATGRTYVQPLIRKADPPGTFAPTRSSSSPRSFATNSVVNPPASLSAGAVPASSSSSVLRSAASSSVSRVFSSTSVLSASTSSVAVTGPRTLLPASSAVVSSLGNDRRLGTVTSTAVVPSVVSASRVLTSRDPRIESRVIREEFVPWPDREEAPVRRLN